MELLHSFGNRVSFTPSKRGVSNKQICPDDDLIILNIALEKEAIIVSNDGFYKFIKDAKYKKIVSERILMYSIVGDS
jgi:hypothetical protein